jgi:hypothetical protein
LVCKYTIWQPCRQLRNIILLLTRQERRMCL